VPTGQSVETIDSATQAGLGWV